MQGSRTSTFRPVGIFSWNVKVQNLIIWSILHELGYYTRSQNCLSENMSVLCITTGKCWILPASQITHLYCNTPFQERINTWETWDQSNKLWGFLYSLQGLGNKSLSFPKHDSLKYWSNVISQMSIQYVNQSESLSKRSPSDFSEDKWCLQGNKWNFSPQKIAQAIIELDLMAQKW